MTIRAYQPKGGMCRTCQHAQRNCSALPFDQMPAIERTPAAIIVRCAKHQRRPDSAQQAVTAPPCPAHPSSAP